MKTFDIALKYLQEAKLDFSHFDIYSESQDAGTEEEKLLLKNVENICEKYQVDKNNTKSNETYRGMVFAACLYHVADLSCKRTSYFDVACEIIESHKSILKTKYEIFANTVYPKIMVDEFKKYCNELNPQPFFLSDKSEVAHQFFYVAFHYIVDED